MLGQVPLERRCRRSQRRQVANELDGIAEAVIAPDEHTAVLERRAVPNLLQVARYVARNPVEGGLCDGPGEWAWSSHAATLSAQCPRWLDATRLLAYFGAGGGDARRRYADFVELR